MDVHWLVVLWLAVRLLKVQLLRFPRYIGGWLGTHEVAQYHPNTTPHAHPRAPGERAGAPAWGTRARPRAHPRASFDPPPAHTHPP